MYRQFTKAEDQTISETIGVKTNAPTRNLAVGNRPSMTDSNVLPKKPSVELGGKRCHYQAVCRTKNIGKVHHKEYDSAEDSDEEVFLGAVHSKGDNQWTISIELNGKPTEFQIDTGAEASLIPEEVYKKIGSPTLHQIFRGPNNAVIPVTSWENSNTRETNSNRRCTW